VLSLDRTQQRRGNLRAERSNVQTCRDDKKAFLADFQQRVREYAAESPEQLAKTITLIEDLEKRFATHSLQHLSATTPVFLTHWLLENATLFEFEIEQYKVAGQDLSMIAINILVKFLFVQLNKLRQRFLCDLHFAIEADAASVERRGLTLNSWPG
jgi:hypothetical protein